MKLPKFMEVWESSLCKNTLSSLLRYQSKEDKEDIMQEALLKLIKNLDRIEEEFVMQYIYKSVKNQRAEFLRRQRELTPLQEIEKQAPEEKFANLTFELLPSRIKKLIIRKIRDNKLNHQDDRRLKIWLNQEFPNGLQ